MREGKNSEDITIASVERQLTQLDYTLTPDFRGPLIVFLRLLWDQEVARDARRKVDTLISRQWAWDRYMREHMVLVAADYGGTRLILGGVVGFVDGNLFVPNASPIQSVLGVSSVGAFLSILSILFLVFPIYIPWFILQKSRAGILAKRVQGLKEQIDLAYAEWLRVHQNSLSDKIKQIETDRDSAMISVVMQYQRSMAGIAAEHERTLADITARYKSV